MRILFTILVLCGLAMGQLPSLPNWVNNNELIDGTVTPAAYEYELGASSWITGPPSGCTFGSPLATAYPATGTGLQAFINAMEACRTYGQTISAQYGIILDLPVTTLNAASSIVIPQSNLSGVHATTPLIVRSIDDAALAALPEPVCAGGIQDNIVEARNIGLRNPNCDGTNTAALLVECPTQSAGSGGLAYQLGVTNFCIAAGTFTLANGVITNTANYNYAQYMPTISATGIQAPMVTCSIASTATATLCNYPSSLPAFGPDYWLIEDIALAEAPGNNNNMDLVAIDDRSGNTTSITQWASHIHYRRVWGHGDWYSLAAGNSQISTAVSMGQCYYCSITGSQISEVLRPSGEGHIMGASGTLIKISNNWFEGQSSCVFVGGASSAPSITPIGTYIGGTDMEHRRTRCTFPLAWLGSPYGPGNVSDANQYWGGAGDNPAQPTIVNIASNGLTVTYVSGPAFHDSSSFWPNNNIFLGGATKSCGPSSAQVTCKIASIGSGSWSSTCVSAPPGTCPTTLTLSVATTVAPQTGVAFLLNGASVVRKNGDEKKSFQRLLLSGNITENIDPSGGQRGILAAFSNRNVSGGAVGTNYQNTGTDLNAQDDIYRNGCEDLSTSLMSNPGGGDGGGVATPFQRMAFTNIFHGNVTVNNPGCSAIGKTLGFGIYDPAMTWTGLVTENATGTAATFVATSSVDYGAPLESDAASCSGSCPFSGGNITITATTTMVAGEFASFPCSTCAGATGNPNLDNQSFQIVSVTGSTVVIAFGSSSGFMGGLAAGAQIQGPAGGQYLGIPTGFAVTLSGCTNPPGSGGTVFNTPSLTLGPLATVGSSAWTGVWFAPVSVGGVLTGPSAVTYNWPPVGQPAIAPGSTATCTLTNGAGAPQDIWITKQTVISDAAQTFGVGNQPSGGAPNFIAGVFQDNIFLSAIGTLNKAGWFVNGLNEGNASEVFQFNQGGATISNSAFTRPSGAASQYAEYCNNPIVPLLNCHASSPPTTIFFPTSSCAIGFVSPACSGQIPLNLPDFNSYALAATVSGSPNPLFTASSTGGPIGSNFPAILAAETANTYVCMVLSLPATCTNGPYPDIIGNTPPVTSPTAPAAKAFASLQHQTLNGGTE
jgi:hypothetical protein